MRRKPFWPSGILHAGLILAPSLAALSTLAIAQTPQGSLREVGNEVRVSASVIPAGGGAPQDANWRVEYLKPGPGPGLTADIYLISNPGSLDGIDTIVEAQEPNATAVIANPHWSNPDGGFGYPAEFREETGQFTANQEGFFVDHLGEIFIPGVADRKGDDPDVVNFKDGVDDYSYLEIDGQALVDDNSWTGTNGTHVDAGNTLGSPIAPMTVSDDKFDDGEWVPFRFVAAEGGGGDSGVLYWDALDGNGNFPGEDIEAAERADLVPDANFRTPNGLSTTATESGNGQPSNQALPTAIADDVSQLRLYVNDVLVQKLVVNSGAPGGSITQTGSEFRITAGIFPSDGSAAQPADYTVEYYKLGLSAGINADIYMVGNPGNLAAIENVIAAQEPAASVIIANPHWSEPGRGFGYPEEFRDATGFFPEGATQENFFVDHTGQIYLPPRADRSDPASDVVRFKDGVDDYCLLVVDGVQLVDDNNWTGQTGADNGGSPIVEFDVSEERFDDGEWVSIRFIAAEGGGGDSGIIYWDALDTDGNFPQDVAEAADIGDLIPNANFRAPGLEKVKEVNGSGTPVNLLIDPAPAGTAEMRLIVAETEVDRLQLDGDGDGMPDDYETANGFDPASPADGPLDKDSDGLTNAGEFLAGTKPQIADTDGDTLTDGAEVNTHQTDPLKADGDNDVLDDGAEIAAATSGSNPDTDGDTIVDGVELLISKNPLVADDPGFALGLVGYWPLDSDLQDTVSTSHGEGMGGSPVTYDEGKHDEALVLDGVDQFVQIDLAREKLYDFTWGSGFTVSSWFTVNSFSKSWQCLVAKGEGNRWRVHRRDAGSNLTGNGGNADVANGGIPVDDGAWHHLALVSVAGEGVTLYVDGQVEGTSAAPALENNNLPVMIGENPDARGRTWDGKIDDLAMWARPLTEEEVMQIWNEGEGASIAQLTGGGGPSKPAFAITEVAYLKSTDGTPDKVRLTWNSKASATYAVEAASNVATWEEQVDGQESGGTQTTTTITLPSPAPEQLYLRVRQE